MIVFEEGKNFHPSTHRMQNKLKPYLIKAMEDASDELIKIMGIYAHTTTYIGNTGKGAPGDPEWRNEIDRELKKLYTDVAEHIIEGGVGVEGINLAARVRVMLIAYGSGSRAQGGGSPIHEGPAGRSVWNDSLTGRHQSKATRDRDLPVEFNQVGNEFPERAVEEFQRTLEKVVDKALSNIPADVITGVIIQY